MQWLVVENVAKVESETFSGPQTQIMLDEKTFNRYSTILN